MSQFHSIVTNLGRLFSNISQHANSIDCAPSLRIELVKAALDNSPESFFATGTWQVALDTLRAEYDREVRAHKDAMRILVNELSNNHKFIEAISGDLDTSDIAQAVADNIDVSSVADYISARDVAAEMDAEDIAGYIDAEEVARHVDLDADAIAGKLVKDCENEIVIKIVDEMCVHFGDRMKDECMEELTERVCAAIAARITKNA